MEKDLFNFHDPNASIDEIEVCSFNENDPTKGGLVNPGEDHSCETPLEVRSRMSLARRLWYTARSLSWWKGKALVKQEKNRSLEKKIQDLSRSRDKWKQRAVDAEKQVKAHAEQVNHAQAESSLKQTLIFGHE